MPVRMRKLKSGKVRVSTPGGVKAKATTLKKAKAQASLLNAAEHGMRPTGQKGKPMKKSKKRMKGYPKGSARVVRHSPAMLEIDHRKSHAKPHTLQDMEIVQANKNERDDHYRKGVDY